MWYDVPYKKYTKHMMQSLVEGVVKLLNYFPSKNRVSDTMIPSMIVEVKVKIYMRLKIIEFGLYAMVYLRNKNTIKRRSVAEIMLK